jgi:hypothetical protein
MTETARCRYKAKKLGGTKESSGTKSKKDDSHSDKLTPLPSKWTFGRSHSWRFIIWLIPVPSPYLYQHEVGSLRQWSRRRRVCEDEDEDGHEVEWESEVEVGVEGLAQKAGSGEKAGSEPSKCRVRTKVPSQGPGEVQSECRASAG